MTDPRTCRKCGSDRIARNVHLKDRGHGNFAEALAARFFRHPGAIF